MLTQLAKMMFLATFFPMPELEEEDVSTILLYFVRIFPLFSASLLFLCHVNLSVQFSSFTIGFSFDYLSRSCMLNKIFFL